MPRISGCSWKKTKQLRLSLPKWERREIWRCFSRWFQQGMWDFCCAENPSLLVCPVELVGAGWGISLMFLFVIDSALSLSSPCWNLSLGVSWGNMFFLSLAALFLPVQPVFTHFATVETTQPCSTHHIDSSVPLFPFSSEYLPLTIPIHPDFPSAEIGRE